MKPILFIIIVFCNFANVLFAQMSIEYCYQKAQNNYPLIIQYQLIEKMKEFSLSNANKGYLPQVSLNVKATYQSDVTDIPIKIPGITIPGLSKDQYSAAIELNQLIWDGGAINSIKKSIIADAEVQLKQTEVSIYSVNDKINQLYFGILLIDAKLEQNQLLIKELQRNFELVFALSQNGVAAQSDLDAVKVEQIKALQNSVQLNFSRKSYIEMLSLLIGEKLAENTIFSKPTVSTDNSKQIKRIELSLFDVQNRRFDSQEEEIKNSVMPKIGLVVTAGYGKPGLNMLSDDFSAYYFAGLNFRWNLGKFYTRQNNYELLALNREVIETQKKVFLLATDIEIAKKEKNIEKSREILKYDEEIIKLKNSIKQTAEIKLANGTYTVSDLLREISAEDLAKQNKIHHEIELLLAIYELKFTTNNWE